MSHTLYRLRLKPQTAFATPLRGDTLFGQCCWQFRHQGGEAELAALLDGYREGRPFLVLSDAFPAGYLPRPTMSLGLLGFDLADPTARKAAKSRRWLPHAALTRPLHHWQDLLVSEGDVAKTLPGLPDQPLWQDTVRTHNSLNRLTNTTGSGEGFAPYERGLTWHHPELELEVFAACDERLSAAQLQNLVSAMGLGGYGKEASSGLGKFDVLDCTLADLPHPPGANAWLTLAPCAPQGGSWQAQHCYYDIHVRFGRHGMSPEVMGSAPWKNPVLMADRGAILTPASFNGEGVFVGQGLGDVSRAIPATVHQGYAPVVAVAFEYSPATEEVR